jgi:hypothetical protein
MRPLITTLLALAVSAAIARPSPAEAGVDVQVNIGLPVAPPLVVVQPGVSVVEDWHEEVYFVAPYYWVRRGDVWYRARSPNAAFVVAPRRVVPVTLVEIPPGKYVKYKKVKHHNHGPKHKRRDRGGDRHHDHRDHDHGDRGHGRGNGKHGH